VQRLLEGTGWPMAGGTFRAEGVVAATLVEGVGAGACGRPAPSQGAGLTQAAASVGTGWELSANGSARFLARLSQQQAERLQWEHLQ